MGFLDRNPFNDIKPSMLPPMQQTNPNMMWSENPESKFGESLAKFIKDPKKAAQLTTQKSAAKQATLQLATLQKSTDHFGLNVLSAIDQNNTRANTENVHRKSYINYNSLFSSGALTQQVAAAVQGEIKQKKKINDDDDIIDADDITQGDIRDEDTPGKGFTNPHNVNLYSGAAGFNPFKKEDSDNFKAFENEYAMITKNFMGPMRALGKDVWDFANKQMSIIQSKTQSIKGAIDPFKTNEIDEFDIKSNYNSIIADKNLWDSWSEDQTFGFMVRRWSDIKNYSKTLRAFTGKAMDQEGAVNRVETKAVITADAAVNFGQYVEAYQALSEEILNMDLSADDVDDQRLADIKFQTEDLLAAMGEAPLTVEEATELAQISQAFTSLAADKGLIDSEDYTQIADLSYVTEWLNTVGKGITPGMKIPFGLMAEVAGEAAAEQAFGNWGNSMDSAMSTHISDEEGGFMDKAITGYLQYLNETKLSGTTQEGVLSEKNLAIDNDAYGAYLFESLIASGFIDQQGAIIGEFTPGMSVQDITADISIRDKAHVLSVLNDIVGSSMNLDRLDHSATENRTRHSLTLIGPDGEKRSLDDTFELIGAGDTYQEKYANAREAYNTLFDVMTSMMKLETTGESNGKLKLVKTNQGYEAEIYPQGEWIAWNPNAEIGVDDKGEPILGAWETVSGEAMTMTFSTQDDAKQFFDKIRETVTLLEPMLGSFEDVNNGGPGYKSLAYIDGEPAEVSLRFLIDNEGALGKNGAIQFGSSEHQFSVDTAFNPSYFKTEQWQGVSKHLTHNVAIDVGSEIFRKTIENRISKMRHKTKKENYKARKKEHEEREDSRIKGELKARAKRRGQVKAIRKQYEQKVAARYKKQLQEAKKSRAKSKAQQSSKKKV